MLRNIKEYNGEIILYYKEEAENKKTIEHKIEKSVKVYEGEIVNIVFKVGITSKDIELISAQTNIGIISCKTKDLYYECSYNSNQIVDSKIDIKITLNVKDLSINQGTDSAGDKEEPKPLDITYFIMSFPKISECTVQTDKSISV